MLTRQFIIILILVILAIGVYVAGRTAPWRNTAAALVLGILLGYLLGLIV